MLLILTHVYQIMNNKDDFLNMFFFFNIHIYMEIVFIFIAL